MTLLQRKEIIQSFSFDDIDDMNLSEQDVESNEDTHLNEAPDSAIVEAEDSYPEAKLAVSSNGLKIRDQLKYKIAKRIAEGKSYTPEIHHTEDNKVTYQPSEEEIRKQNEKKERNKQSACKSRQKKKEELDNLMQDHERLVLRKDYLDNNISMLRSIYLMLEEPFIGHKCLGQSVSIVQQAEEDEQCVRINGGAEPEELDSEISDSESADTWVMSLLDSYNKTPLSSMTIPQIINYLEDSSDQTHQIPNSKTAEPTSSWQSEIVRDGSKLVTSGSCYASHAGYVARISPPSSEQLIVSTESSSICTSASTVLSSSFEQNHVGPCIGLQDYGESDPVSEKLNNLVLSSPRPQAYQPGSDPTPSFQAYQQGIEFTPMPQAYQPGSDLTPSFQAYQRGSDCTSRPQAYQQGSGFTPSFQAYEPGSEFTPRSQAYQQGSDFTANIYISGKNNLENMSNEDCSAGNINASEITEMMEECSAPTTVGVMQDNTQHLNVNNANECSLSNLRLIAEPNEVPEVTEQIKLAQQDKRYTSLLRNPHNFPKSANSLLRNAPNFPKRTNAWATQEDSAEEELASRELSRYFQPPLEKKAKLE